MHEPSMNTTSCDITATFQQIDSWTDLTEQRRRDLRSALACAVEIAKPHALELSCTHLNELLYRKTPAAYGLAAKRFANIVSALRAILRRLGRHAPTSIAGPDGLEADWQRLMALLPTRERQLGLIRFAKFCSASGIAPDQACQDSLQAFEVWLRECTITDDIPGLVRRTGSNWRWAAAKVAGWPQAWLQRASARDWYSLPLSAYGSGFAEEAEAHLARLGQAATSLLDEIDITDLDAVARVGRLRPLKPRSIDTARHHIRIAAAALVLGPARVEPARLTSLRHLVQPIDHAVRIMDYHWNRAGKRPTQQLTGIADQLLRIARQCAHSPPQEIRLLEGLRRKVKPPEQTSMIEKNRQRLIALLAPRNRAMLLHFPDELLRRASATDLPPAQAGRMALFAIALEMLLVCPMRRQNLAELRLDRHLHRPDPTRNLITHLFVPGSEVKNGEALEWPIPHDTARRLQLYLTRFRPLLAEAGNPFLFPGTGVKPKSAHDLGVQLSALIAREIGVAFNLHLMRHFAVVTFLDANPGQYEIVRRVLGHRSVKTTVNFYAGLEANAAARLFSDAVADSRTASKTEAEAQFRTMRRTARRVVTLGLGAAA